MFMNKFSVVNFPLYFLFTTSTNKTRWWNSQTPQVSFEIFRQTIYRQLMTHAIHIYPYCKQCQTYFGLKSITYTDTDTCTLTMKWENAQTWNKFLAATYSYSACLNKSIRLFPSTSTDIEIKNITLFFLSPLELWFGINFDTFMDLNI